MKKMYFEIFDILIRKYKTVESLWNVTRAEIEKSGLLSKELLDDFFCEEYRKNLNKKVSYMKANNINIVTCYDDNYPCKLKFIKNRPIVLHYKGDISKINEESVAVVGSRNSTEYGRRCCSFFSYELAKRNVNVISGLALGIDSVAHCSSINANGITYAVIGSRIG